MSALARTARQHQRDTEYIQTLKHQFNASRANFVKALTKIQALAKELGCLMQETANHSLMWSPYDRIYINISATLIPKSRHNGFCLLT
jgi:hypothetical protein